MGQIKYRCGCNSPFKEKENITHDIIDMNYCHSLLFNKKFSDDIITKITYDITPHELKVIVND